MAQRRNLKIKGIPQFLRNLNKEITKIKGASLKGLGDAADVVLEDTEKTPPLVPIGNTGHLHNSKFKAPPQSAPGGVPQPKNAIVFGFSAIYAAAVHEMDGKVNWNRPNSGPFFFGNSLMRNRQGMLKAIRDKAKIR